MLASTDVNTPEAFIDWFSEKKPARIWPLYNCINLPSQDDID